MVALVIFTTWKPLNAIWGSYLFGLLYWLYQLPTPPGISVPGYVTDLIQMVPYLVTHRRAGRHLSSQKARE